MKNVYAVYQAYKIPAVLDGIYVQSRECYELVNLYANEDAARGTSELLNRYAGPDERFYVTVCPVFGDEMEYTIYTHDEAAHIVDMFEDVLDKYGIRVPSPDDDQREDENEAKLYGMTYWNLLDKVEDHLIDLLDRAEACAMQICGEFSGH